jgi:Short C-terminal domain
MAGKSRARRQDEQAQQDAYQDQRIGDLEQQQSYQQPPQQQQAYQQPPQQQAPPPAAAPSQSSAMLDQLNQLAALHQQGVLTDEEFAAAKAKLFAT